MRVIPQTIAGRLVLFIGLTNCLILAATVSFNYARTRAIMVEEIDAAALKQIQIAATQIDDFLAKTATRAEMIASHEIMRSHPSATARLAGPQNDPELVPLLARMLKDTSEDEAYGLWFCADIGEPEAPIPTADPLVAVHRHSYPNRTAFPQAYLTGIPAQEWYAGTRKTGKPHITEPYYDDGGGNISMVSLSQPCINAQGRFIGVTGVDLALSHICRFVAAVHYTNSQGRQDGFAFLV
ncbi:MAG: cache domain-containing protein, partial [bacterium]